MATTTILSRVKTDFFAILVPGSFIFCVIATVYMAFSYPETSIIILLSPIFKAFKEYWPLVVIFIIIGFLVGNIIRAVPVNVADKICKKIFSMWLNDGWDQLLFSSNFPYRNLMVKILKELNSGKLVNDIELPNEHYLHTIYNYWKIAICSEMPDVFIYTQNLESRVRLFSGMFWAGVFGVIGSLSIWAGLLIKFIDLSIWLEFNIILSAISVILFFMFGKSIRRIRSDEVGAVFMAFLFLQQKKKNEKQNSKTPVKSPVQPANVIDFISRFMGSGGSNG